MTDVARTCGTESGLLRDPGPRPAGPDGKAYKITGTKYFHLGPADPRICPRNRPLVLCADRGRKETKKREAPGIRGVSPVVWCRECCRTRRPSLGPPHASPAARIEAKWCIHAECHLRE